MKCHMGMPLLCTMHLACHITFVEHGRKEKYEIILGGSCLPPDAPLCLWRPLTIAFPFAKFQLII
jgi:hypothetical protein